MTQQSGVLVTGGLGFIGSNFIRLVIRQGVSVVNLDACTYASNPDNLSDFQQNPSYTFKKGNICDRSLVDELLKKYQPRAIVHFAAESHVDRSIDSAEEFITTNVQGTLTLLEAARNYWQSKNCPQDFRFLHVSTDEVYGSIDQGQFTETSPYLPNSPYAASKASSNHLARAFYVTYSLPTIISNASNNYGPYQFPEKLIPLMTLQCIAEQRLPVYGTGANVRDWMHVDDHCRALQLLLEKGNIGEVYNVGGDSEFTNLQIVEKICQIMDEQKPRVQGKYQDLIEFVTDRPGHDLRYALNSDKLHKLGWQPQQDFNSGLVNTVEWYLKNEAWWRKLQFDHQQRLGLAPRNIVGG